MSTLNKIRLVKNDGEKEKVYINDAEIHIENMITQYKGCKCVGLEIELESDFRVENQNAGLDFGKGSQVKLKVNKEDRSKEDRFEEGLELVEKLFGFLNLYDSEKQKTFIEIIDEAKEMGAEKWFEYISSRKMFAKMDED